MTRQLLLGGLFLLVLGPTNSPAVSTSDRWALANANGTLEPGFGVVSTVNHSAGIYTVTFNRNLTNCAYTATLDDPIAGTPPPGFITVGQAFTSKRAVVVITRQVNEALQNHNFYLLVSCKPEP